jgi:sugar lactone lactonase YvrE
MFSIVAYAQLAEHGESPVWNGPTSELLFVDIVGRRLLALDRYGTYRIITDEADITSVCLAHSGELVLGGRSSVRALSQSNVSLALPVNPKARLNEAKSDAVGRLWIASMDIGESSTIGELFRVEQKGVSQRILGELIVGNGIGWSTDNSKMYLTDSLRGELSIFDFDLQSGDLSNRRIFAKVPKEHGFPDGLTVDSQDGVWSAHFNGGRVTRYLPNGKVDFVIHIPVRSPTSLCFGGEDYSDLYVTSSRLGSTDSRNFDGSVIKISTNFNGLPSHHLSDNLLK